MSKEKMQVAKQTGMTAMEKAKNEVEMKQRELQLSRSKDEADRRILEQCDKYIEAVEKNGPDSVSAVMIGTMLDVIVPLRELAGELITMSEMMNTLDSTLGLIDFTMNGIFNVFGTGVKYGAIERIKNRRQIRIFNSNFRRRMSAIQMAIKGVQSLSVSLRKSLAKLSLGNAKRRIRSSKRGGAGVAPGETMSGKALELVNARRGELGKPIAAADTAAPTADSGRGGAGAPGVDDIMPKK